MLPGFDGFHWTFGHVLFLSVFFAVLVTLAVTVVVAAGRSLRDLRTGKAADICWHADFEDMPASERRCRHELAGRVPGRTCPNAFDCRHCADYVRFAGLPAPAGSATFGMDYPSDRLYHRGHTWVRPEEDGVFTVGLDDMANRLVGRPDTVQMPPPGEEIAAHGTAWQMTKNGRQIRVRAPIDGIVVATGGPEQGWYLKLQARENPNLRHLLSAGEVSGWLSAELERLQVQLGQSSSAPALADGGILMPELMDALPAADWDATLAGTFLEP